MFMENGEYKPLTTPDPFWSAEGTFRCVPVDASRCFLEDGTCALYRPEAETPVRTGSYRFGIEAASSHLQAHQNFT